MLTVIQIHTITTDTPYTAYKENNMDIGYIKTRRHFIVAYLNYENNNLTLEHFAEEYGLTEEQADLVLAVGCKYYDTLCEDKYRNRQYEEEATVTWTTL